MIKNICIIFLFVLSINAKADLLADCNALSSEINKTTPKTIDKVTILKTSSCFKDGNIIVLNYSYVLGIPVGTASQTQIDGMKKGMLQAWCSDPDTRKVINLFDIDYRYGYKDGTHVGKIRMSKKECS